MTNFNDVRPSTKNDGHRNTDAIRQDIAQAEQEMSQTVEQIGDRIKEKLDWQEYVKERPYVAMGVAAGVGLLASTFFAKKRTPMDRILDSVADEVRHAAGGLVARTAGPGLVKVTLLGIASKAAVGWLQNAAHNKTAPHDRGTQTGGECRPKAESPESDSKIIV